ncbi:MULTISPECIES: hypothetical protein [unclassified Variovorax]|uniref:hypothetical protein n=1 Tax=unclassified Variovorax TaxID=663243 RepID=UPI0008D4B1EA|nr:MULTISPECIES: hypothetical protein [unclassified Variovorax]SEK16288.1 hypothetical protein SAMN05518853_1242 [Variovorax sp. OK202]SFE40611.1 hypothetical protein SAMN05444746_12383 [Variovorax sp. OK212]
MASTTAVTIPGDDHRGFPAITIDRLIKGARFVSGSARVLGLVLVGAAAILLLIQSMLYVRTGWGVEDFAGWADDGAAGPAAALLELWRRCQLVWLAQAYFALDSALFVPLYAAFFLKTGRVIATALDEDTGQASEAGRRWFVLFWVPVLMLVAVDLLENMMALGRTGGWGPSIGVGVLLLGLLGVGRLANLDAWQVRAHPRAVAVGVVALVALVAAMYFSADACAAAEGATWRGRLGCAAHQAKWPLTGAVLLVLAAGGACWLFGVVLSILPDRPNNAHRCELRADLRAAIFDCIVRSRYVLAALALLAGLTVVMDQSRDIIASTASFVPRFLTMVHVDWGGAPMPPPGTPIDWGAAAWLLAGSVTVFAVSVLALAMLVFACWLWTRSVCHLRRSTGRIRHDDGLGYVPVGKRHEDFFARDWARVLALVPVLLVVVLCANVLQDLSKAQVGTAAHGGGHAGWPSCLVPSLGVVAFAVLAVFAGGGFIWRRSEKASTGGYYDCIDWKEWSERFGLLDATPKAPGPGEPSYEAPRIVKYNFLGKLTPYLLPLAALALVLACRLVDVLPGRSGDYFPSMAFPVILLSLTFWLCVFGWLSLLEVRTAVPWVLVFFAWVGVLGVAGLTDNHIVWPGPLPGEYSRWGGIRMLVCTALLACVLAVAYRWAMARVRASTGASMLRVYWPLILTLPALAIVIVAGNLLATARRPGDAAQAPVIAGVALDAALAQWLRGLCHAQNDQAACNPQFPANPASGGQDVYFVSTEGGGIRAAMWTAMALHSLEAQDPSFAQRSFAISGVSGGAVGAAVYRACGGPLDAAARERCIMRFAQTDLLSPLLSSWMFEDLLGRVVPSGVCKTPGCGFMSRGAWFEQTMEVGAPRLRKGMRELHRDDAGSGNDVRHVPYLLLNATWVETGERAIASELRVSQADFPGSKDQLGLVGADMPLGAAAHNAARFPYVNAIGGLKTPAYLCDHRGADVPAVPDKTSPAAATKICGHLADGGYFDNGGAQSTADLVRALSACLTVSKGGPAASLGPCEAIPAEQRKWLRENLVPRVLMIRNESDPGAATAKGCGETGPPTRAQVIPADNAACTTAIGERYQPARPVCARGKTPYLDLIGPLLAVINTSGVGAGGRLAEAREGDAVMQARLAMGGKAATARTEPVTAIDLLPKGVHFPLGWHLSHAAVDSMKEQAGMCSLALPAAKP